MSIRKKLNGYMDRLTCIDIKLINLRLVIYFLLRRGSQAFSENLFYCFSLEIEYNVFCITKYNVLSNSE